MSRVLLAMILVVGVLSLGGCSSDPPAPEGGAVSSAKTPPGVQGKTGGGEGGKTITPQ